LLSRLEERVEDRALGRAALQRLRAVAAAAGAARLAHAALQPPEVRLAVGVVPQRRAGLRGPPVVTRLVAALVEHPVDAAGAAEDLAAGVGQPPAVQVRLRVGLVAP